MTSLHLGSIPGYRFWPSPLAWFLTLTPAPFAGTQPLLQPLGMTAYDAVHDTADIVQTHKGAQEGSGSSP